MKKQAVIEHQEAVLGALSYRVDDFYLAGGTALSLFYFQHRLSIDLDFFTPCFSQKQIGEIIGYLSAHLKKDIKLTARNLEEKNAKVMVYYVYFSKMDTLKIDFVEDVFPLIKKTKNVEGIRILSLEDIYLRKIYAMVGILSNLDAVGRKSFVGGRAEAKDFYDLYFLSNTFMPLSQFTTKYGDAMIKEGLVRWFRTYDRMGLVDGILRLKTKRQIDCKNMEKHFSCEIDKILENQISDYE